MIIVDITVIAKGIVDAVNDNYTDNICIANNSCVWYNDLTINC